MVLVTVLSCQSLDLQLLSKQQKRFFGHQEIVKQRDEMRTKVQALEEELVLLKYSNRFGRSSSTDVVRCFISTHHIPFKILCAFLFRLNLASNSLKMF